MNKKERNRKEEKELNEMARMAEEESSEGGYFTKLRDKLGGDKVENNLKRFTFKKEVLNNYSPEVSGHRFVLERGITTYLRDKFGIFDVRSIIEREDTVSVILVDLIALPKDHQDWWYDHLIEED